MDETKSILTAILGRLDELGASNQSIVGRLDRMSEDFQLMKNDITVLKSDVAVLKSDVAVLKSDVAEMKDTQTRHERILELLSVRTIENEASIRELKRLKS